MVPWSPQASRGLGSRARGETGKFLGLLRPHGKPLPGTRRLPGPLPLLSPVTSMGQRESLRGQAERPPKDSPRMGERAFGRWENGKAVSETRRPGLAEEAGGLWPEAEAGRPQTSERGGTP